MVGPRRWGKELPSKTWYLPQERKAIFVLCNFRGQGQTPRRGAVEKPACVSTRNVFGDLKFMFRKAFQQPTETACQKLGGNVGLGGTHSPDTKVL